MALNPGDPAPDFHLLDQHGDTVSLSDFKGDLFLLYFYPKADTPGCTTQACCLRDAMPDFEKSGVKICGVSPDEPAAQRKFAEKYSLPFPLLSDPDHAVAEAYGAWGEKSLYGKTYFGVIRSSFLIDQNGLILDAWIKVAPKDTVPNAQNVLA
ncbi:MAG: thioredoxin-dependent thiol peroxidase [Lentisphaeria bacterium]|nr:thioredoxin-dependent thiol peroxidase [Lentisphaeria bacterium]